MKKIWKDNGWKALVLAAYTFLVGTSCAINNEEKNTVPDKEVIEVTDIIPSQNIEIQGNDEVIEIIDEKEDSLKNIDEIAHEVILGLWGNGDVRKNALENAGYNYDDVCARVNELLKSDNQNIKIEDTKPEPESDPNLFKGNIAYINQDSKLYDNNLNEVNSIEKYQKVMLNNIFNNDMQLITNEYGNQYYIENSHLTQIPNTYVEVDISDQKLYMFVNDQLVLDADVITGHPLVGTVPGTNVGYTSILSKEYQTKLNGTNYVDVFMKFNDNCEGFHDADEWRADWEYDEKDRYLTNGSHGCVNMKQSDVDMLDEYTEIGTPVLIHK